jgi:hypothetical protein
MFGLLVMGIDDLEPAGFSGIAVERQEPRPLAGGIFLAPDSQQGAVYAFKVGALGVCGSGSEAGCSMVSI